MSIPWRYLPPNLATFGNVCVSVAAIRSLQLGDVDGAAWLVLLSMLLDKVDGTLARALNAQSRFGVEMDSFADFLAFGLVPGLLLMSGQEGVLGLGSIPALLYIGCCLARLVRFNVVDSGDAERFRGVPSTAAGGVVASFWLTTQLYGVQQTPLLLGVVAIGLGLAMVSSLPLPKVGKSGRRALDVLTAGAILGTAALILLRTLPQVILGVGVSLIIAGAVVGLRTRTARAS